jgi:hypothetical protein
MRASANVVLDVIRAELSRGSLDRNHAGAPAYGVTRIKEIKQDGHDRDGEHPTKGRVGFALSDRGTRVATDNRGRFYLPDENPDGGHRRGNRRPEAESVPSPTQSRRFNSVPSAVSKVRFLQAAKSSRASCVWLWATDWQPASASPSTPMMISCFSIPLAPLLKVLVLAVTGCSEAMMRAKRSRI